MNSLYRIVQEFKELESLFESEQASDLERFQKITELLQTKTDEVAFYYQSLEDFQDALEKRQKEIEEASLALEAKMKTLKSYVRASMIELGTSKMLGKTTSVALHKARTRVEVKNIDALPPEFLEVKTSILPKLTEIRQAIESGLEVPGAEIVEGQRPVKFKVGP